MFTDTTTQWISTGLYIFCFIKKIMVETKLISVTMDRDDWKEFKIACIREDSYPSKVLREFIKTYANERNQKTE